MYAGWRTGNRPIAIARTYEELIDFIVAGTTPESVIKFQPSEVVKEWIADLIFQEKNGELSTKEKSELDRYLLLEHLLRLAKIRDREYMTEQP